MIRDVWFMHTGHSTQVGLEPGPASPQDRALKQALCVRTGKHLPNAALPHDVVYPNLVWNLHPVLLQVRLQL